MTVIQGVWVSELLDFLQFMEHVKWPFNVNKERKKCG